MNTRESHQSSSHQAAMAVHAYTMARLSAMSQRYQSPHPPAQHASAPPSTAADPTTARRMHSTGTLYWPHALAAGSAGVLSSIFSSPFDVIRTRLQIQNTTSQVMYKGMVGSFQRVVREEGVRGLYRGFGSTLFVIPAFWSIYFTSYSYMKNAMAQYPMFTNRGTGAAGDADALNWVGTMMSAVAAGAVADTCTNPLYVARTRLQTQHMNTHDQSKLYKNTWSALVRMKREEGIRSWYKGWTASLLGLSHVCLQFPLYESLKVQLPRLAGRDDTLARDLIIGSATSKVIASTATYPLDVLRSRLQYATPGRYDGLMHCARTTIREEGVRALYKGMGVNIMKTTPSCAITFVTYECLLQCFEGKGWFNKKQ